MKKHPVKTSDTIIKTVYWDFENGTIRKGAVIYRDISIITAGK